MTHLHWVKEDSRCYKDRSGRFRIELDEIWLLYDSKEPRTNGAYEMCVAWGSLGYLKALAQRLANNDPQALAVVDECLKSRGL